MNHQIMMILKSKLINLSSNRIIKNYKKLSTKKLNKFKINLLKNLVMKFKKKNLKNLKKMSKYFLLIN